MSAYLRREEAATRLGVELADAPSNLDLRLASEAVDAYGPFVGYKADWNQERQFPRREWAYSDALPIPENVLDAVCLLAALEASPEQVVAVTQESDLDTSVTYSAPVVPDAIRRAGILLRPYIRVNGRML